MTSPLRVNTLYRTRSRRTRSLRAVQRGVVWVTWYDREDAPTFFMPAVPFGPGRYALVRKVGRTAATLAWVADL